MLETLTRGFKDARNRFRGVTELTDENVAEALKDVRMSLLEADVDLDVVRGFLEQVTEKSLGREVRTTTGGKATKKGKAGRVQVSAGDHFTKTCYEELVRLMGEEAPLPPAQGTRVVMLLGLQGTGKTSTAAKLARHLKQQGEKPLLVAADVRRPAAREQLRVLGEQVGVPVYDRDGQDAAAICAEGVARAREQKLDTVILDTAGRLQIDDELMTELEEIVSACRPDHSILCCDSMMGREAVHVAKGFAERVELDGLILTKLDADARGGAALAIRHATGLPVRYVTVGEATDRLEAFRPEGMASRILGMGDVVGLMQDFEQVVDTEEAEAEAEKLLQGKFTLQDFLSQLSTLQKMGPLKDLVDKLPGVSDMMPEGASVDGGELKKIEAMILSMTPGERERPEIINESRTRRISQGSGTSSTDLGGLLQRFGAMQKMMAQLGSGGAGGLLSKIPGLGKAFGGGAGLDPAALAEMGMPGGGNRAQVRAARLDQKRKKRKQLRKHKKRRGKRK
ncbi:MAG: signal recognition particle protein [Deltaproteobacteria bacterium]|nr:signal recognition particle protein [Deltaproteobacteria bacterium]MBW2415354.1 signal recognition particle protein [Deltaproteobacteria bacterium]